LAAELGVSETTIRRWRERTTTTDRSHTPKRLMISLSAIEEELVCELRTRLQLPLDDIAEVMHRCVNEKLSRSAIHRCLVRHGLNRRPSPDKPLVGVFETATVGFIHVDLKHLPALEKLKSYAFVAIDRATRYVYLEIHPGRDADTAAGFLNRFLAHFPHRVHTILTDNGSEFTDRFAVDMKNKPHDRPSGRHPFDRVCAKHRIDHRLGRFLFLRSDRAGSRLRKAKPVRDGRPSRLRFRPAGPARLAHQRCVREKLWWARYSRVGAYRASTSERIRCAAGPRAHC
jgi:hypothetical protein